MPGTLATLRIPLIPKHGHRAVGRVVRWSRSSWPLLLLLLTMGCSTGRHATVGEGLIQKRRLSPGWHVDLGLQRTRKAPPLNARVHRNTEPVVPDRKVPNDPAPELAQVVHGPGQAFSSWREAAPEEVGEAPQLPAHALRHGPDLAVPSSDRDPENLMPRGRFNAWSIPSLLFVLGAIAMALLTNNGALVAGMLVVGLFLAGFSLARIRSREQRGKVYALVALVLGTVAALITAMVILRSGF